MKIKHLFLAFFVLFMAACKEQTYHLTKIEGKLLPIEDNLSSNLEIDKYFKPFHDKVEKDLDSTLAYAKDTYTKNDGELNTAIGNFLADVVFEQANPVFKSRTGKDIDMVILNHGGIRSIISKGNITLRTAYEVMPFENSIVVVALKDSSINNLVNYLAENKRAHPISRLKLQIDSNFNVSEALINGQTIDSTKTYYVATNDYLYYGGDNMSFLKKSDTLYDIQYKIRNALIDYLSKVDTINPVSDDRFTQIK